MDIGPLEFSVMAALLVALALGIKAALAGWGRWNPASWADRMGLRLTPLNEAIVRTYIIRTRVLRFTGALLGLLTPGIYRGLVGHPLPVPVDFVAFDALIGYLLGAVVAELTIRRPAADEPSASLEPRELSDYMPAGFITALRGSALVALVLVPLTRLLPARQSLLNLNDFPSEAVILPAILLIGAGVELLQRYIVARSQPAVELDLVNADDAIRSASVHALAGAGIALELLIITGQLINLAVVTTVEPLRWTFPVLAIISTGLALGSWIHLTKPFFRGRWQGHETTHA